MDIYKKYLRPDAPQKAIVLLGRVCVVVFAFVAVMLAPQLGNPKISNSIFTIIQEGQGLISPGVLAVFTFGLLVRRAPAIVGAVGLLTNMIMYSLFKLVSLSRSLMEVEILNLLLNNFLNRMAVCFGICIAVMTIITVLRPLKEPVTFEQKTQLNLETSNGAKLAGAIVIIITIVFYILFSPIGLAK